MVFSKGGKVKNTSHGLIQSDERKQSSTANEVGLLNRQVCGR